jgi:hypothetical protein
MIILTINADNNLELTADPELLPHADTERLGQQGTGEALIENLEYYLCNGWDWVNPEDVGALTAAPILSNDAEYDEATDTTTYHTLWYHERYMIEDPIALLLAGKTVTFINAIEK